MVNFVLLSAAVSSFSFVHVNRVIDGDTIVVEIPEVPEIFSEMSVRIKGIDSPEMKAKRKCEREDAREAKEDVETLLADGMASIYFCEADKYYRLLCTVISMNGTDISEHLINSGQADLYAGGTKKPWKCRKYRARKDKDVS